MTAEALRVNLAGMPLDRSRHVCAFFHSKGEQYDVLLPFIMVIIGGTLQVNPFFVPPDEMLRELRARKERGAR